VEKSQRTGLWICLAVLAFILVQAAGAVVLLIVGGFEEQPGRIIAQSLFMLGLTALGVWSAGRAFWKGWRGSQWVGFGVLALFGALVIWFAYWQTTLDFPNATSPEERARMQESSRRAWPWITAWGGVNLVAGAFLFLPPVGRFLLAQREKSRPGQEKGRS
jgi:hypothetical protein